MHHVNPVDYVHPIWRYLIAVRQYSCDRVWKQQLLNALMSLWLLLSLCNNHTYEVARIIATSLLSVVAPKGIHTITSMSPLLHSTALTFGRRFHFVWQQQRQQLFGTRDTQFDTATRFEQRDIFDDGLTTRVVMRPGRYYSKTRVHVRLDFEIGFFVINSSSSKRHTSRLTRVDVKPLRELWRAFVRTIRTDFPFGNVDQRPVCNIVCENDKNTPRVAYAASSVFSRDPSLLSTARYEFSRMYYRIHDITRPSD